MNEFQHIDDGLNTMRRHVCKIMHSVGVYDEHHECKTVPLSCSFETKLEDYFLVINNE